MNNYLLLEYPYLHLDYKFDKKKIVEAIKKFKPIVYNEIPDELKKYHIEKYNNSYFIIKDIFNETKNINNITDYFSESVRITCKFGNHLSPKEYWNKYKNNILDKTIEKYKILNICNVREIIFEKTKLCNNFRISVALTILDYFKPSSWLDISAGWGDRLIASILCKLKLYVSCDPNLELHPSYNNIITSLVSKNKQKNYIIYKNGFLEAPIVQNNFDIVFSSPPFFDLEKYSNFPEDSIQNYKTEKEWCDNFLIKALIKAYNLLKLNGHIVLYVGGSPYVMLKMHLLDKIMNYKGIIYFYEKNPRAMFVWEKINDKKIKNLV